MGTVSFDNRFLRAYLRDIIPDESFEALASFTEANYCI